MKRQYKFRAWDEKIKKMFYSGYGVGTFITNSRWWVIEQNDVNVASSTRENILMQYTGLKDKNGVEIYEGDVISYNKSREVVYFDTSLRIPCFTTGIGLGSSTKRHPYVITKRHEVIGNIWENPELLK